MDKGEGTRDFGDGGVEISLFLMSMESKLIRRH